MNMEVSGNSFRHHYKNFWGEDEIVRMPIVGSQFEQWYSEQHFRWSDEECQQVAERLTKKIRLELKKMKAMSPGEYALWHKWREIQDWYPKQKKQHLDWVKRLIWKPRGLSDFRRIQPELIYVSDGVRHEYKNFWGEDSIAVIPSKEPFLTHWEILRTLVSTGRNDGFIGRQLRFLVRDKNTRQYLGVICIASSMMMLKPRNDDIGIKDPKTFFQRGSRLTLNTANGQSIVPTQPFGMTFLGGKLLSLLCLSDVVAKKWEEVYGQKLVEVHTTSLWGNFKEAGTSQYDNLNRYWKTKLGDTSGITPFKLSDSTYREMKEWMKEEFPYDYFKHFVEKGPTGQLGMRENKSKAIEFVYRKLGIDSVEWVSDQKRGVYRALLYKNTDEFLRNEINEDGLEPWSDRQFSVEVLTDYWRFGEIGDTRNAPESLKEKEKNKPQRIEHAVKRLGLVKARLDRQDRSQPIPTQGGKVDWYQDLAHLTWEKVKEKYLPEVGR
jgi:hypothetical protein